MKSFRNICFPVLVLLAVSCGGHREYDPFLAEQDRLVYENPAAALENLEGLTGSSFEPADEAYFNLLLTIARDKNYYAFENDSLILESCSRFSESDDSANSSRAYLYLALVRYRINAADATVPELLLKAEERMTAAGDSDAVTLALLYAYLGRLNFENCNWNESEHYYGLAAGLEETVGNFSNLVINTINVASACLGDGKLNEAEECIRKAEGLIAEGKGSEWTSSLNNVRAIFLSNTGEVDSALAACRLWTPFRAGEPDKYNLMASLFTRSGDLDSAILYQQMAIDTRLPKDSLHYHLQHRALAGLYAAKGMHADALEQYGLAYERLLSATDIKASQRIAELEKQYDVSRKETELAEERQKTTAVVSIALALTAILLSLIQTSRARRKNAEELLAVKTEMFNDEQRVSRIAKATSYSVAGLVPAFGKFANKLLSVTKDTGLFDEASAIIESVKARQMEEFSKIVKEDMGNIPPALRSAMELFKSDSFKIVLFLSEKGYSNKEIAGMTSQTADGIRATKSQIRKVLLESDIISDSDKTSLKLLSGA